MFFGVLFFLKKANKRRKTKSHKNYLHCRTPNKQQKKKREIFLDFLLILQLTKHERKTEKKRGIFLDFQDFPNHTKIKQNKAKHGFTMKTYN